VPQEPQLKPVPFVINERPLCLWEGNLETQNLRFLEGIRPAYFDHAAMTSAKQLDGEERYLAAMSLRLTYSHALETLFALLGTTVQAPSAPAGWMLKYRNEDLNSVVEKMQKGQFLMNLHGFERVTFEDIAKLVLSRTSDGEKLEATAVAFGKAWEVLAEDYLSSHFDDEHNSIKHGLRVSSTPAKLYIGNPDLFDRREQPSPEDIQKMIPSMSLVSDMTFGGQTFTTSALSPGDKVNLTLQSRTEPWNPVSFVIGTQIAAMSIHNTLKFLRVWNGENVGLVKYKQPADFNPFYAARVRRSGENTVNFVTYNPAGAAKPMTKSEILDSYR
jgi:hypothetical protein